MERVEGIYSSGRIELPRPPIFGLAKYRQLDVRKIPGVTPYNILATRLAPPAEPRYSGAFFSSVGHPEAAFPQDWPTLVFVTLRYLATAAAVGLATGMIFRQSLGSWIGWLIFVALLAWLFVRRYRQEKIATEQVHLDHQAWLREKDAWSRLCYCGRDELVFTPGSLRSAGPDEWRQVIAEI